MLHLPHVAELVRDEVVRDVPGAKQDRAVERATGKATQPRNPEEPGGRIVSGTVVTAKAWHVGPVRILNGR